MAVNDFCSSKSWEDVAANKSLGDPPIAMNDALPRIAPWSKISHFHPFPPGQDQFAKKELGASQLLGRYMKLYEAMYHHLPSFPEELKPPVLCCP